MLGHSEVSNTVLTPWTDSETAARVKTWWKPAPLAVIRTRGKGGAEPAGVSRAHGTRGENWREHPQPAHCARRGGPLLLYAALLPSAARGRLPGESRGWAGAPTHTRSSAQRRPLPERLPVTAGSMFPHPLLHWLRRAPSDLGMRGK